MRFFLFGPRFFGVRPGVSFRPDEVLKTPNGNPNSPTGSFVYVIENGRGNHKVGWTANPTARLATLQTGSPDPLKFAYIGAASGRAYEIEQAAHGILSAYRCAAGEWFIVPADMAVASLTTAAFRLGENLLQVTPAQADEILRVAASMPPEDGKRPISGFTWFMAALFCAALLAEYRFAGDDVIPFMAGTAGAAMILLPAFAKFC